MGETATEKLIVWLIVLFLFVVLPAILQAMAKRKAEQAPRPREDEEEEPAPAREEEERPARSARGTDIKRYLESIGVRVERKVEQAPQEEEPLPEAEPAPPAHEEVRIRLGPFDFKLQRPAPPPPPARPERRRIQALPQWEAPSEPLPARPEPALVLAEAPEAAVEPPQSPGGVPVRLSSALASHPSLSELRRAVVLSEVLRRPDFRQLPCDREVV